MKIKNGTAYLGDCLEIMRQIPDGSIDCIIADIPYGSTHNSWDSIIPFEPMWNELNRVIKPNGAIALFGSEPFSSTLRISNIKNYKYDWTWIKEKGTGFLNSKKQPLKNNETISIFYKKQCTYNPQMRSGYKPYRCKSGRQTENYGDQVQVVTESNGERYPLNTIEFPRDKSKIHPTQKPVALIEYLIRTYTHEGETVLDFTAGSFTLAVAAENTNRKWICIEKDENYFNIGINRLK